MESAGNDVTYFGETTYHRKGRRFGIRQADRLSHFYALGKTGVGKSSLLAVMAGDDVAAGRGFALLDPHGDLADSVAEQARRRRPDRLIYLNAPDRGQPFGYNPLPRVRTDLIPLAASGLLETFRKLWPTAWGVRMEHVLRSSLYALLEREGSTLPDVLRLYADKDFRKAVTRRVQNPVVRAFWEDEFATYSPRLMVEAVAPIQNKLGALLSDPTLYRILVEPETPLSFRQLMDQGKILVVNLSKGRLGEDSSAVLGSLIVSTIGLAALSRASLPERARFPFILYADEFQNFTTLSFANLMAELRKYGLGLVLANQHLAQLDPEVRDAVLSNAGTVACFRVGADDAGTIAREFQPIFGVEDVLSLANRHFCIRLMINGTPSRAFSARVVDL